MKRFSYLLACAASALIVTACSDSETSDLTENTPVEKTFTLGIPSSTTRTVVDDLSAGSPYVLWETTDQIYVWGLGSTNASTFSQSKFGSYHNYSTFSGTIVEADKYWFMYPNQEGASFDGSEIISATIPQCQKAVAGSFDPAAAICTGVTEGQNDLGITMLHACAFLKITTTKKCQSITVAPANDSTWKVTGDVQITTTSSGSSVATTDNGYSYVKLTADGTEDCTDTFEAGTYLMAIAPSSKFPGFTVTVDYPGNSDASVTNSNTVSFNAACIYNLGTAK